MNKNLKVVSSLALAGILATTGLTGISKVSAAEVDPSTKSLGKYASLGGVENVVPYILNAGDKVTIKDLKNEFNITTFNGNSVLSEDTVVGTGDKFKSGNTTYTVIVYGDTNGDGLVDSDDAFDMLSHYVGNKTLNGIYLEAANVEDTNRSDVDSDDAYRTKGFYVGNVTTSRDKKPPKVDPVEEGYTLTVGENNVVNNVNNTAIDFVLDIDNAGISDKERTISVKVTDSDNKVVTGLTFDTWKIKANTNKTKLERVDLSSLENGTYTIEIKDTNNKKVLARKTIDVKVDTPVAAKINATRPSATTAALSLEGYGEGKIVTIKYTITDSKNATSAEKTIENVNNKLTNKTLDYVLPEGAATMDITLVDEFGNKDTITDVKIPKHGATAEEAVAKVKAPVLKDVTAAEFAFLDKDENAVSLSNAEAILYDGNGKIIAVEPITTSKNNVDFTTAIQNAGKGKYKVGVIVKGDGVDTTDSAEVLSDVVEVKELNAITNVKFAVTEDGDKVITFEDSNKEANVNSTTPYAVSFELLNEDGEYEDATVANSIDEEKHTITMTALKANTIYKATIVVKRNTAQLEYVENTNPTVSAPFFYIDASDLLDKTTLSKTDKTLTYQFKNNKTININGTEATYKAVVNKILKDSKDKDYTLDANKETKNVTVTTDEDGHKFLTIEGLAPDQRYTVKIIASVGSVTGESDLIGYDKATDEYEAEPKTYATAPAIKELRIVNSTDTKDAVAGTLYIDGDNFIVNGDTENVITKGSNNYAPEFDTILTLAQSLLNNDVLTVNNNESVILELTEDKSSSADTIELTNDYEGMEVTVKGRGIESDRAVEVADGAKLAKLNVEGNGLILALDNGDDDTEVCLNNGAEVTGANKYTLTKGATAKVWGVTVNSNKADVVVNSTALKTLTIEAPKGNVTTDLVFTNNNNGRYATGTPATIDFTGVDTTSEIVGTVKINSEAGSVVVTANDGDKLDLTKLNLDIDVKEATEVDIKGFTDASKVNVSVKTTEDAATTTTVKAMLGKDKLEMLDKLATKVSNNDIIILQQYDDETDITLDKGNLDEADKTLMQNFIDSFNINSENVKMKFINVTTGEVEITVEGDTQVNLSGFATYGNNK